MRLLIDNAALVAGIAPAGTSRLCGAQMERFGVMERGWVLVESGRIAGVGEPGGEPRADRVLDAGGGAVLPAFCDSHTHIVYAGSREGEFMDRIRGLSYERIAERGGGILNSVDLLRRTSEQELYRQAMERVGEMTAFGTGCAEIKSGYGLSTRDEVKMLRVIARIAESSPMKVRATFLGAHAVAREYRGRQEEYVELVCREMIPAVAAEGLADFVDVFCDRGFFTVEQTRRIVETGARYGMRAKIHANELDFSGGVQLGVACGALSVDHLERSGEAEIAVLAGSQTVPTLLPGASFFLGMPYAPAREMIDAGLGVALASDYNPGSSPSGNMRMVMSLGCIAMRMTAREALAAATLNGACAMDLSDEYGSITPGKVANLVITKPVPSLDYIPYAYSSPLVSRVLLRGVEQPGL